MPLSTWTVGQQVTAAHLKEVVDLLTGVMTDQAVYIQNANFAAITVRAVGLTGATSVGRYGGVTTTGAPVSGTWAVGDWITTQDGRIWMCTAAGTPGTWVQPSPPPNTIAGNIQPIGTVAAAGSTGLSADAGHVHTGGGLLSAANVWSGKNSYGGAALSGGAASAVLTVTGGALGTTAGNATGPIASFGGTTTNETELGIRLWRRASGSDWTTTALLLSMDVDATVKAGAFLSLSSQKFLGINIENPASLLDVYNPSGTRVLAVDNNGTLNPVGAITSTGTITATGMGGGLLSSLSPLNLAYGSSVVGTGTVPSRQDHQHTDQYVPRLGTAAAPSDAEAKHLFTAVSRPGADTGVVTGDILFNA